MNNKNLKFGYTLLMLFALTVASFTFASPEALAIGYDVVAGDFTVEVEVDYWSEEIESVTVSEYKGMGGEITLPQTVMYDDGEHQVTAVKSSLFEDNEFITKVNIPEGYLEIGGSAFENCDILTEVNIAGSVTTIGYDAFAGNELLSTVNFAAGDADLELFSTVFGDNPALTSLTLPARISEINNHPTSGSQQVSTLAIEGGTSDNGVYISQDNIIYEVNSGDDAFAEVFAYAHGLNATDITLLEQIEGIPVTTVSRMAFLGNAVLEKITVPASINTFEYAAFNELTAIEEIVLEADTITADSLGDAFEDLKAGSVIKVANQDIIDIFEGSMTSWGGAYTPDNTTLEIITTTDPDPDEWPTTLVGANIKDGVLLGYYGLGGDIIIPNTVTQIGNEAFLDNDTVTSVTIPGSVSSIGYNAFQGATELEEVIFADPIDGADLIIRLSAFADCPKLTTVEIPATAIYVTANVFKGSTALTEVQVHPQNPYYFTDEYGVMFGPKVIEGEPQYDEPTKSLNSYPAGRTASHYDIPSTVDGFTIDMIWPGGFEGAKHLTSIGIPASLLTIGTSAFEETGLVEMTIPATVTDVGDFIFEGCEDLVEVTFENNMGEMPWRIFEDCTALTRINFPSNLSNIGFETFLGTTSLTSLIMPATVDNMGNSAFENTPNLELVVLSPNLKYFEAIDGWNIDTFEDASDDLLVIVQEGTSSERWAEDNFGEWGHRYLAVPDVYDFAAIGLQNFSLMNSKERVMLDGGFQVNATLDLQNVSSGQEYQSFAAAAGEHKFKVYQIGLLPQGVAMGEQINISIGLPTGYSNDASLYIFKNGQVQPLSTTMISKTLVADSDSLGYIAVIDTKDAVEADPTIATSVELNKNSADLKVDETVQLSATVYPTTASDKSVNWASSDDDIATVSNSGLVTAVAAGTATITATTANGLSAGCVINVEAALPPVTGSIATTIALESDYIDEDNMSAFGLYLTESSNVANIELTFETDGSDIEVVGLNDFTLLSDELRTEVIDGKYMATVVLSILSENKAMFNEQANTKIAEIKVTGKEASLKITSAKVSGWNESEDNVFGQAIISKAEATYVPINFDINGDDKLDLLDLTEAQKYYMMTSSDSDWATAQKADLNGDGSVTISDYIILLLAIYA